MIPLSSQRTYDGAPHDRISAAPELTPRQREILRCIACGMGDKQIAVRLGISPNTVRTHIERLFDSLGVRRRAEAVAVWLTSADGVVDVRGARPVVTCPPPRRR